MTIYITTDANGMIVKIAAVRESDLDIAYEGVLPEGFMDQFYKYKYENQELVFIQN